MPPALAVLLAPRCRISAGLLPQAKSMAAAAFSKIKAPSILVLLIFSTRQFCGLTCLLYTIAEFFADFVASFMDKQRKILYAIIK